MGTSRAVTKVMCQTLAAKLKCFLVMTTASKLVALVSNQKSIMKCTVLYAIGASKVSDTHTDSD